MIFFRKSHNMEGILRKKVIFLNQNWNNKMKRTLLEMNLMMNAKNKRLVPLFISLKLLGSRRRNF